MPLIGLLVSNACQVDEFVKMLPDREVETANGSVTVKMTNEWAVICRSGFSDPYVMPHEYNTKAHLAAFQALEISEVVGVHTSGSLRPSLAPGMLVIPDDWINIAPPQTILSGQRRHLTPSFSRRVRQKLADAAWQAQVRFENGGIYWQTWGPRLETKAEIKLMSNFADLVGMGLATEANLAQEMGLEYAAICSVDNYANGLGSPMLTDDMIQEQCAKNLAVVAKVLERYIEPAARE